MVGQLGLQTGLKNTPGQLGQEPALAGELQLTIVDLGHQIVEQTRLDHRFHRPPSRRDIRFISHDIHAFTPSELLTQKI